MDIEANEETMEELRWSVSLPRLSDYCVVSARAVREVFAKLDASREALDKLRALYDPRLPDALVRTDTVRRIAGE